MTTAIVSPSLVTVYINLQDIEVVFPEVLSRGISLSISIRDLPLWNLSAAKSVGGYCLEGPVREGDQFPIFCSG